MPIAQLKKSQDVNPQFSRARVELQNGTCVEVCKIGKESWGHIEQALKGLKDVVFSL